MVIIIRAVVVTAVGHILHKVGVHHITLVLEDLVVAMGLDHLTTHKVVVNTVALVVLEEVRTQWVVLETNRMDGNSKGAHMVWSWLVALRGKWDFPNIL